LNTTEQRIPFALPALPGFIAHTGCSAPSSSAGTFVLTDLLLELFPFAIRCLRTPFRACLFVTSIDCNVWTLGSHVPYKCLCQARAAFMPDTAWAVNRLPPDLSRVNDPLSVSMSLIRFRHFISGSFAFTFLTSPDAIVRAFSTTFTTLAFTSAACGGLMPPPVRRLRRAFLHHLYSTAFGVMYSTYMSHLLRSWHTVISVSNESEFAFAKLFQSIKCDIRK
jgi:hypothetical protein